MAQIEIPKFETGTTRVFSLSMDATTARKLRDDTSYQAILLGAAPPHPEAVEVFALSDLGDMGLTGFLLDGVDADPGDINRDKAKLGALEGWVMLIHSSAFAPEGATLTPDPALTLIGTYSQTPADKPTETLEAEAAKPYTGTPPEAPPEVTQTRSFATWVVIALGFVVLAIALWALT